MRPDLRSLQRLAILAQLKTSSARIGKTPRRATQKGWCNLTSSSLDLYSLYVDFLETAESKRHWTIFDDVPWDNLDLAKTRETDAQRIELFCAEEMYLPDYIAQGMQVAREMFGSAWFQARWAFEESKHGFVFREYLARSGLRTQEQFATLEAEVFSKNWKIPFATSRRMACYGALQEGATYVAYKLQCGNAVAVGDKVLEAIFFCVGRDEAAHAGFYRAVIGLELASDRSGTIADLAHVLSRFKMPGDGLIPNYRERLKSSGAGISPRVFLQKVISPLLNTLHITGEEMKLALKKDTAAYGEARRES